MNDEEEPEPFDPEVWRWGIAEARRALQEAKKRNE